MLPTNQCIFGWSEKNKNFDYKYNLSHESKVKIIKSIGVDDCVDIRPNDNSRYPDALVFIFLKEAKLDAYGEVETVTLYIKEYIVNQNNMEMVVVISFHEEGLYD